MIGIFCSTADEASMNIRRALLDALSWASDGSWSDHDVLVASFGDHAVRLYTTDVNLVYVESLPSDVSLMICATKHDAKSGIPSLSCHAPGNWSSADYGGDVGVVGVWPVRLTAFCYNAMCEAVSVRGFELDVVHEATHHGPTFDVPCMFIEIGSTQKEWVVPEYGDIIASVLLSVLTAYSEVMLLDDLSNDEPPVALGIGGLHTCPRYNKRVREGKMYLGHVCPHYQLEHLTVEAVVAAAERCVPRAAHVYVDWKGLKTWKDNVAKVLNVLEQSGFIVVKLK